MSGAVRLRWSSHLSTIVSTVNTFLADESLVDVTLTCDGQTLHAHKLILSACSPYFHKIFSSSKGQGDPVVFLKGVKFTELEALIQFVYRGEVNIAQEDLPSFLTLAEELQIRGLANQEDTYLATQQIRSKILEGIALSSEPVPQQNPSTPNSPPPLKKARTTNTGLGATVGTGKDFENGIGSVQNLDSVASGNPSSEEPPYEQIELSEDEDEDGLNMLEDTVEDDNNRDYSMGMTRGGGFTRRDWTEVLAEDENSAQFSLSDPESWKMMDSEGLEIIPDDDDDDIQEISGGPGGMRNSSGGADNEPSLCTLCNKQFQKRKTWNTHCLYDCPMVPPKYSCPKCEYRARRGYQLKIHCLKIHGLVT